MVPYYYEEDGERKRKRRTFTSMVDAKNFVLEVDEKRKALGEHRAMPDAAELEEYYQVRSLLPPGATLMDLARAYLAGNITLVGTAGKNYSEVVNEYWVKYTRKGLVAATYKAFEAGRDRFLEHYGDVDVSKNITKDLLEYHVGLLKSLSWATVRRQVIFIGQVMDYSLDQGWAEKNWIKHREFTQWFPKKPKVDKYWLRPAQVRALLLEAAETDLDFIPVLALGLFAGIRPEEISHNSKPFLARFKFDQVDWKAKTISIREAKRAGGNVNASRVIRGLPETVWLWLGWWRDRVDRLELNLVNFSKRQRRLVRGVGYDGKLNSLYRKTFITHAVPFHGQDKTRKQVGHTTAEMTASAYEGDASEEEAESYFGSTPSTVLGQSGLKLVSRYQAS